MLKRALPLLMICLLAASAAEAQPGGGKGRGGGARSGPPAQPKAFSTPEFIGVIKAIEAETGRVTIVHEGSEALNWPPGTQPFVVGKSALLKDLSVGEKVRFTLESQQISAIRPF